MAANKKLPYLLKPTLNAPSKTYLNPVFFHRKSGFFFAHTISSPSTIRCWGFYATAGVNIATSNIWIDQTALRLRCLLYTHLINS